MRTPQELNDEARNDYEWKRFELSVVEAIHQLYETVLKDAELHFRPNRWWNMETRQSGFLQ